MIAVSWDDTRIDVNLAQRLAVEVQDALVDIGCEKPDDFRGDWDWDEGQETCIKCEREGWVKLAFELIEAFGGRVVADGK